MKKCIITVVFSLMASFCMFARDYYELVDSAELCIQEKEWERAEVFIKEALRVQPDNFNNSLLLSNLATVQRYQGRNEDALKNYSIALFMTPNAVTLLKNRASLYLDMDSIEKAYSDYGRVLELDDMDIEALYNHGVLALEKKEMEASKDDFEKIKRISHNSYFAYNGLAMWNKANGNYPTAINLYGTIIKERPSVNALANRAECLLELKQLNNADKDIKDALAMEPTNGFLYLLRAKLNKLRFESDAVQRDINLAKQYGVDESVIMEVLK